LHHIPSLHLSPFLLSFVSCERSIRAQPPTRSPQISPSSRAISECRNLRCRCTERADDGIVEVARVGGRPPQRATTSPSAASERARCYGTSPHGHRLGQVSDKARSHQVLRGLSVCVRSRATEASFLCHLFP